MTSSLTTTSTQQYNTVRTTEDDHEDEKKVLSYPVATQLTEHATVHSISLTSAQTEHVMLIA